MIDEDGRIFGKINIIDLLIILAVAFVIFFISKKLFSDKVMASNTGTIEIKFFAEKSPDFAALVVNKGDRLEDESKNIYLGKIANVVVTEGYDYGPDSKGNIVKSPKEGYNAIEITSEIDGLLYENGVILSGNKYQVGHPITVRAGKGKVFGWISSIESKTN